jgi:adenylate cyclase
MNQALIDLKDCKILVVDDVPANLDILVRSLQQAGYDLYVASNGESALRVAALVCPDLILLDVTMPGIDGFETCRRLKAQTALKATPVVFLTARSDIESLVEGFQAGGQDYITKPFNREEIVARVQNHLERALFARQRDEAFAALQKSQNALQRSNAFIRQIFGRYVSDEVVDTLLERPDNLDMGGETRKVTILMTDLRGFTPLGERLPPDQVVKLINIYLSTMTDVIMQYQGTIDEFIGDAILAVFGAPVSREDDADRALACAVAMQQAMEQVNEENARQGLPTIAMGIGLNTGEVVVGNIGSEKRAKYSIVGRHVNIAARVESYTVGGQIYASEYTRAASSIPLRIDSQLVVEPKGVREALTLYAIGGVGAPYDLALPALEKAELYPLNQLLEVQVRIVAEKDTSSTSYRGQIAELGPENALLHSSAPLAPLDNVKIALIGDGGEKLAGEIYAKTMHGSDGIYTLRFTSLSEEAKLYLKRMRVDYI